MQIAFFGASLISAYCNGAATYYRGILRALHQRGHRIRFYEPLISERELYRDIVDPPWALVIPFPVDGEGVEAALEHASGADIIIKASTVGAFDDLLDQAVPHATATHGLSIYWDIDPAATLKRLNDAADALATRLPSYDVALVRGGGAQVIEAYRARGVPVCLSVHNAVDPALNHPVDPEWDRTADLAFLGHCDPARINRIQQLFLNVAERLPRRRFLIGGRGWDESALPANVRAIGYVYTGEQNLFYSSATAVLNVTSERGLYLGHTPSARLFEAAGAGACVISDVWGALETFFEPDREILLAQECGDVVAQLDALSVAQATAIGRRAHARCLFEHTFAHRAAELEALFEGVDRRTVKAAL
jgi:spore maturation protein CgeB